MRYEFERRDAKLVDPHIDANAYTHVKDIKHLTVLVAVDVMTSANGGLEVVNGSHLMTIPLGSDRCIEPAWVRSQTWTPCDLQPGMHPYIINRPDIKANTRVWK